MGSQASAILAIRTHIDASFWLRRRSVRRHRSTMGARKAARAPLLVGTAWSSLYPVTTGFSHCPLEGDELVHPAAEPVLHRLQRRLHAVATTLSANLEAALAACAAVEGEAEKREGVGLAEPSPLPVPRREAVECDQASLVRMQRQRESRQPLAQGVLETPGVGLELQAHHDVVRVTHDHHVVVVGWDRRHAEQRPAVRRLAAFLQPALVGQSCSDGNDSLCMKNSEKADSPMSAML